MIDRTKEAELLFNQRLKELNIVKVDFKKEREALNDKFRRLDLTIERIQQLKSTQQEQVKKINSKLASVIQLKDKSESCDFKETSSADYFTSDSFGK